MSTPIQTRWATPADAEAIWQLYQTTNFLYPQKLQAMGDGGAAAFQVLKFQLGLPTSEYAIALSFCEDESLLAACTCARFSRSQVWVMHLVSNHNRTALLYALVKAANLAIDSSASWMCNTFRPDNRGVQRLLTRPFEKPKEPIELADYDFYMVLPEQALALTQAQSMGVREGNETDREHAVKALELAGRVADGVALKSSVLRAVSLTRKTASLALDGPTGLAAFAVLERSVPWLNLSNLSTGLRIWLLENSPEVASAMLRAAALWFLERELGRWTLLVSEHDTALTEVLNQAGLVSQKKYQRLCYPATLSTHSVREYARYLGHKELIPQIHERPKLVAQNNQGIQ